MGSTVPAGVKLLSLPSAEGLGDLPATIFSYATITGGYRPVESNNTRGNRPECQLEKKQSPDLP